jgi:hypothetical protein
LGTITGYLGLYLPADNELFDEQANTNSSFTKVDAGVLVEHNGWTAHAAAAAPHSGHALFGANTFTGTQTVRVATDTPGLLLDPGALSAAGVQTGERLVLRAHAYDTGDHQRSFIARARTTTNAGAGVYEIATLLDAQSTPVALWSVDDQGNTVTVGNGTISGSLNAASYNVSGGSSVAGVASSIVVGSPNQYVFLSSRAGSHLAGNAYWDGSNWQRYDATSPSAIWIASNSGITYMTAPAGSGTLPLSVQLTISTGGIINYPSGSYIRDYGGGYVQINQLTVTPGVLAAAGFTCNGNETINGSSTITGNLQVNAAINSGGQITAGQGVDSGSGVYYFAHNGGINWTWTGYITATHGVQSNGNMFIFAGAAAYWSWDGTWVRSTGGSGIGTSGSTIWLVNNAGIGLNWDNTYLHVNPNVLTSTVYLGNRGDTYLSFDGTNITCSRSFLSYGASIAGDLSVSATFYVRSGSNIIFQVAAPSGETYCNADCHFANFRGYYQHAAYNSYNGAPSGGNQNAFLAPNNGDYTGSGLANAWRTWSASRFKENVAHLHGALDLVRHDDLHGVSYDNIDHIGDPDRKGGPHRPSGRRSRQVGFVADNWLPHVQDMGIVHTDHEGRAESMDYSRVTAVLWEAVKQHVSETDMALANLTSQVADLKSQLAGGTR